MQINDFTELTDFVFTEYEKMSDSLGVKKSSEAFIKLNEKTLSKYVKLFNKPLFRKTQRELKIQEAIDTLPHGFLWKLLHWDLWQKVKLRLEESKNENKNIEENFEEEKKIYYPDVVKQTEFPQITEPS